MTGLRYITASGRSCTGYPWSDAQVAMRLAQDHQLGTTDPVLEIRQPGAQAMGQPIGAKRQQAIIAQATQLVAQGAVQPRATAEELAWLRGEDL